MNTYTFYIDELNQIWSRIYIKVDADTKEEAINKCLDGEYSITDAKYLYDTAERIESTNGPSTEIYDLSGDVLYSNYVDK